MTAIETVIEELQWLWRYLPDIERGRAVRALQEEGVTLRQIAARLNCSPSLLSHLKRAAQASPEDLAQARRGELSTRELARRARPDRTVTGLANCEQIAFQRECAAIKISRIVRAWLSRQEVSTPDCREVIDRAQRELDRRSAEDGITRGFIAMSPTPQEAIEQSIIALFDHRDENLLIGLAHWLASWIASSVPQTALRSRILELARQDLPVSESQSEGDGLAALAHDKNGN